jgi:hypothetical protein
MDAFDGKVGGENPFSGGCDLDQGGVISNTNYQPSLRLGCVAP